MTKKLKAIAKQTRKYLDRVLSKKFFPSRGHKFSINIQILRALDLSISVVTTKRELEKEFQ